MLALALAAALCGGPGHTLAVNDRVRVFERAGAVRVCHRERRGSWRLRAADGARVAGRYVLLRRGPALTVYDARRRRREGAVTPVIASPTYTRIVLRRNGGAAYLAVSPAGEVEVGSTRSFYGIIERGFGLDTRYLRYAGPVVAFRMLDGTYRTTYADDLQPAPPGEVARSGSLRIRADRDGELTARLGRRRTALGRAATECVSSSGCSGVDGLRLEQRFVAARSNSYSLGYSLGEVLVAEVGHRTRRTCPGEVIGAFVLSAGGATACARQGQGSVHQIVAGDTVLDEGPGIDLTSLRLRGDQLTWTHDGTERTARLASQP